VNASSNASSNNPQGVQPEKSPGRAALLEGTIAGSNSLPELAARIRTEHEACTASMKRGLQHAIAAGEMLIEAKAQLKHGEWLPWLRDHCCIPERTARLYMRLAANRAQIEAQIGNAVADLSIRGAIALIATPRENIVGHLACEAAECLVDEFDIAAAEDAEAERLIFKATMTLLDQCKPSGPRQPTSPSMMSLEATLCPPSSSAERTLRHTSACHSRPASPPPPPS
jgi:hypothetical protein